MTDSSYCYLHNPAIDNEIKKSRQRSGGRNRRATIQRSLAPITLSTAQDIQKLLAETINLVRAGEIDTKVATTLGYLSGCYLRAYEVGELEKRLVRVELEYKDI